MCVDNFGEQVAVVALVDCSEQMGVLAFLMVRAAPVA